MRVILFILFSFNFHFSGFASNGLEENNKDYYILEGRAIDRGSKNLMTYKKIVVIYGKEEYEVMTDGNGYFSIQIHWNSSYQEKGGEYRKSSFSRLKAISKNPRKIYFEYKGLRASTKNRYWKYGRNGRTRTKKIVFK